MECYLYFSVRMPINSDTHITNNHHQQNNIEIAIELNEHSYVEA